MKTNPILEKKTVIMNVQKHTHAYSFLFLCFEKVAEYIFSYYELSFASLDPDEVFCDLFVHDDDHLSEIFPVCFLFFCLGRSAMLKLATTA